MSNNSTLSSLIDYNPDGFERAIISRVLEEPEKSGNFLTMLCGAPIEGNMLHEFSLYNLISKYTNLKCFAS